MASWRFRRSLIDNMDWTRPASFQTLPARRGGPESCDDIERGCLRNSLSGEIEVMADWMDGPDDRLSVTTGEIERQLRFGLVK